MHMHTYSWTEPEPSKAKDAEDVCRSSAVKTKISTFETLFKKRASLSGLSPVDGLNAQTGQTPGAPTPVAPLLRKLTADRAKLARGSQRRRSIKPQFRNSVSSAEPQCSSPVTLLTTSKTTNGQPSPWVYFTDKSGKSFYYNEENGQSQWKKPDGYTGRVKTDQSEEAASVHGLSNKEIRNGITTAKLEEEVARLKDVNSANEEKIAELRTKVSDDAKLRQEIADLKEQLAKESKTASEEISILKLEIENSSKLAELNSSSMEIDQLRSQLKTEGEMFKKEIAGLKRELDDASSKEAKLKQDITQLQAQFSKESSEMATGKFSLMKENQHLKKEISRLELQLDAAIKEGIDKSAGNEIQLRSKIEQLSKENAMFKEQIVQLKEQLSTATSGDLKLKETIEQFESCLVEAKHNLQNSNEAQMRLSTENKQLQTELEEIRRSSRDSRGSGMDLQVERDELAAEVLRLKTRLFAVDQEVDSHASSRSGSRTRNGSRSNSTERETRPVTRSRSVSATHKTRSRSSVPRDDLPLYNEPYTTVPPTNTSPYKSTSSPRSTSSNGPNGSSSISRRASRRTHSGFSSSNSDKSGGRRNSGDRTMRRSVGASASIISQISGSGLTTRRKNSFSNEGTLVRVGLVMVDEKEPKQANTPGLLIKNVVEHLPAHRAGLKIGDVVIMVGNARCRRVKPDFVRASEQYFHVGGPEVPFIVYRSGVRMTFNIKMPKHDK